MIVQIAGLITLILSLTIFAVAFFVMRGARERVPDGNKVVYKVRKYYAMVLALVLLGTFSTTLLYTPYKALADTTPAAVVKVTGHMWRWEMEREGAPGPVVVPQGATIEFAVTTSDVTHGFGVYDDDGHILAQTQAMPGYTNRLRMVFDKPGTYHVLCMEFCGIMHQNMVASLTVE